jgi:hypothetical protein
MPFRVDGEFFVLQRDNMEIEVKITNMGKYGAVGKVSTTLKALGMKLAS